MSFNNIKPICSNLCGILDKFLPVVIIIDSTASNFWNFYLLSITGKSPTSNVLLCNIVRAQVQIAVTTLSGYSLRQTVHTHCASVR